MNLFNSGNSKKICISFLLIFFAYPLSAQILDTNSSSRENFLAVEGGSIEAKIDRLTPLPFLIQKLNGTWRLRQTGKGYWIGYTDDMYSIAAYKDAAIEPLLNFINSSSATQSKIGAIYTLHLIGIDSRIAGRFYEEFVNKKARTALLEMLADDSLRIEVAELLGRDPWLSDVPVLMNYLRDSIDNSWAIVNLLDRYKLKNIPVKRDIPKAIYEQLIPVAYDWKSNNHLLKIYEAIKLRVSGKIKIEESLFHEEFDEYMWYRMSEFDPNTNRNEIRIGSFLTRATAVEYTDIGNKFQYYVEGKKVFICSSKTSASRILNWWDSMTDAEKLSFNVDVPIRRTRRL